MDLAGPLAVEVDWSLWGEGNGLIQQANAILFADAKHVEEPVIRREGDVEVVELLAVLVNVGRDPAPVAVPIVVVVDVAVESGEAEPERLFLDQARLRGAVALVKAFK